MSCGESREGQNKAFESNVCPWADCVDSEGDLGVIDHILQIVSAQIRLLELTITNVECNCPGD